MLKSLVDAEAPHGDLEWSQAPMSPEEYADELALWAAQGRTAKIEGTLALVAYRGHGLGLAVRTACLGAVLSLGVSRVRTSSDDENVCMRAINARLGFAPVETRSSCSD